MERRAFPATPSTAPQATAQVPRLQIVAKEDNDQWQAQLSSGSRIFKRLLDLVLAPMALLMTLPVLLVCVLVIKIDSPGPAVFRQTRLGLRGRRFNIYKLRTMHTNCADHEHRAYYAALIEGTAHQEGGLYKLVDDRRITRVGRTLRRWSIDEVPQLWNVIRGDMSIVGPRPPLPTEAQMYDDRAWQRLAVKPGLTGLWQVSGRSTLTFEEMVDLDIRYWTSWSAWLEVSILLKSPLVVMSRRGAA